MKRKRGSEGMGSVLSVSEFSAALNLLPETILHLERGGRVHKLYSAGELFAEISETDPVGKRLEELFPPEIGRRLEQARRRNMRSGKPELERFRLTTKKGERHYEARLERERYCADDPPGTILILRDITPLHYSENYQRLIETIFEEATEAILIFPRDGAPRYNRAFCRLFAMECGDPNREVPVDFSSCFGPGIFPEIFDALQRHGAYHGEVEIRRCDGESRQVWLGAETVRDGEGEPFQTLLMFTDISELRESREMLRFTASHDTLTGLPNRRLILSRLSEALRRSRRTGEAGAVMFIDLDNFKEVNDNAGHQAGDAVLLECAARIRSLLNPGENLGRLGGDEFLLIVESIETPERLSQLALEVIRRIGEPIVVEGVAHTVGASVGIAIFPRDSEDRDELLQFADMAMYRAKALGRNRYEFYSKELDEEVRRRYDVERALRYALEHDGFYLVFQPQFDLGTERVVGVETLLRIDERIAGPLHPSEFIPIAEESDLILRIGRWVLTRCCQFLYTWRNHPVLRDLPFALNLSRRQLSDEEWVPFVRHTLMKYRIDPRRIEFEITETAFMQSKSAGFRTIRQLQELGCRISIDDFGTGYSSLSALKEFTVDKLKIDKSFIDEIVRNTTDRTIVKASIAMAHAMGLRTIAEGVETHDQKRVIKLMGCKEIQGFLYSEPKSEEELLDFLEELPDEKKGNQEGTRSALSL